MLHNGSPALRRALAVVAVLGLLPGLAWRPLAQAAPAAAPANVANDEVAIEAMVHEMAQAFVRKDLAAIRGAFAPNFAGPFQIPKMAQRVLEQVVNSSQSIEADITTGALKVVGNQAIAILALDLKFHFGGGKDQPAKGSYLTWFYKSGDDWTITNMGEVVTDWSCDAKATEVVWEDEALRFPVPTGYDVVATKDPQTRKAAVMLSPCLRAALAVAVMPLPVPVKLDAIVAGQRAIDQLFPGSRFLDEAAGQTAGEPSVTTRLDVSIAGVPTRTVSTLLIRGTALYILSLSVTPAADIETFLPEMTKLQNGLRFTGAPAVAATVAGLVDKATYNNAEQGLRFTAPDGWTITPMDAAAAAKQGWAFAVSVKQPTGDGFVFLGAKDLPVTLKPEDLPMLQKQEMATLETVAADAKTVAEETIQVGGLAARSWVCTFTVGQEHKRREVFAVRNMRLFFIIADATPASTFDALNTGTDQLLKTLTLAPAPQAGAVR